MEKQVQKSKLHKQGAGKAATDVLREAVETGNKKMRLNTRTVTERLPDKEGREDEIILALFTLVISRTGNIL